MNFFKQKTESDPNDAHANAIAKISLNKLKQKTEKYSADGKVKKKLRAKDLL